MKEKVRYIYNAKYKSELGICNFEVFRDYDHKLSEVEKKEELYKFNSLLNDIIQIDLNKLKSYNLESTLVEQLISVIDEINEFEVVTDFDEDTDLIDKDELINNREQIIKSGLKVISELYKFFVKLGFSNEEINEWIEEIR